jgi:histidinol phosphatase-like PHP family hydrolase
MNVERAIEINKMLKKLNIFNKIKCEILQYADEESYVYDIHGITSYMEQKNLVKIIELCKENNICFAINGADPDRYDPNKREVQFNFWDSKDDEEEE